MNGDLFVFVLRFDKNVLSEVFSGVVIVNDMVNCFVQYRVVIVKNLFYGIVFFGFKMINNFGLIIIFGFYDMVNFRIVF